MLKGGYIGTGKKIGSATKARSEEYCIPLTCAKLGDNGIMYWGKKGDFRTYTNAISIIADGAVPAGLVYANREEAGVYSHSYFIRLENVLCFLSDKSISCECIEQSSLPEIFP